MAKVAPIKKKAELAAKDPVIETAVLVDDLRQMIEEARGRVAAAVNAGLTFLYWNIGKRIREDILKNDRAGYGEEIVVTVSRQLTAEYGSGFDRPNLSRMIRFAELFPDQQIVVTLSHKLSWSHFLAILPVKDDLAREFYAEMCRIERWSVRTLRAKINSMLFERTAISKKPEKLIKQELKALKEDDALTPDLVFRDPYFLDFLGLKDTFSEKDLESAILRELERFLLELGSDFAFIARQKRITISGKDHYLDLLFYHRRLKRLVLVELKIGGLEAADTGQVDLYLRWLDKHERQPDEKPPIGLILCAANDSEMVELLELRSRGVRVAEYMTELPPRELLEKQLHKAVKAARKKFTA